MTWRMADNKYPWTSGYNRGLRANYVPDEPDENGWSRDGIGRKPPAMALLDPNVKVRIGVGEPLRRSSAGARGPHQMLHQTSHAAYTAPPPTRARDPS